MSRNENRSSYPRIEGFQRYVPGQDGPARDTRHNDNHRSQPENRYDRPREFANDHQPRMSDEYDHQNQRYHSYDPRRTQSTDFQHRPPPSNTFVPPTTHQFISTQMQPHKKFQTPKNSNVFNEPKSKPISTLKTAPKKVISNVKINPVLIPVSDTLIDYEIMDQVGEGTFGYSNMSSLTNNKQSLQSKAKEGWLIRRPQTG